MKLIDVIRQFPDVDDELTIYVADHRAATPGSEVVLATEPPSGALPPEAGGMEYFLGVRLAKDAILVWSEWRDGRPPTPEEACQAVIHYAVNDAYMPPSEAT